VWESRRRRRAQEGPRADWRATPLKDRWSGIAPTTASPSHLANQHARATLKAGHASCNLPGGRCARFARLTLALRNNRRGNLRLQRDGLADRAFGADGARRHLGAAGGAGRDIVACARRAAWRCGPFPRPRGPCSRAQPSPPRRSTGWASPPRLGGRSWDGAVFVGAPRPRRRQRYRMLWRILPFGVFTDRVAGDAGPHRWAQLRMVEYPGAGRRRARPAATSAVPPPVAVISTPSAAPRARS
jgi:hypothetical protein